METSEKTLENTKEQLIHKNMPLLLLEVTPTPYPYAYEATNALYPVRN